MKNKTLFIHAGMDKTGTSAIQSFMYKNRDSFLRDSNLCYVTTGIWHDFSHHPFAFSTIDCNGYTEKNLFELFRKLKKEILNVDKTIISSECLFKCPLKDNFKTLFRLLNEQFEKIKIIIYVRRQDHWVESRHKHSIISGSEIPIKNLMQPFFCDYKLHIDHWTKAFRSENIIVRAYEKSQFVDGNIFSDFLSILKIKLSKEYTLPTNYINTSLRNDETEFKKLCNRIGFFPNDVEKLNQILCEHASGTDLSKNSMYFLSPMDRHDLINRYACVNSSIAHKYLNRRNGILFYEDLPSQKEQWRPYLGIDALKIIEIGKFISERNHKLLTMINFKVKKALNSKKPDVAEAGSKLSPLLELTIK